MSTASSRARIRKALLSLTVLAVLAFTLAAAAYSGASFSSGTANPATVFTAGRLLHSNDRAGQITVQAADLLPGGSSTGTIQLTNSGTVPGTFSLSASGLSDIPSSPRLSDTLTLLVRDASGASLYDGRLSGFSTAGLGVLAPGGTSTLTLTVAYPDGAIDIDLQGAATALSLQITGVTS